MTAPDADGWITHDGGNCPVSPDSWVQLQSETQAPMRANFATWSVISRYRVFAPVTPGPSPFVAETAARIMAGFAAHPNYMADPHADWAVEAVRAAQALDAALKEVKP